jgi:mannose-1-phosphate guanylyltransferase
MENNYYAVILAGGGGKRLWPLSRKAKPKQTLSLNGSGTLFQVTVERLKKLFSVEKIIVVTSQSQAETLKSQYPEIPSENFLLEPFPLDTAPAIGLAAQVLLDRNPKAVMATVTADHFIKEEDKFIDVLRTAYLTALEGYIVTLGISPTYPALGFGYIQQGSYIKTVNSSPIFKVKKFTEKPNLKKAKEFLAGEEHSWNSGNFVWQASQILKEFERQIPETFLALSSLAGKWNTPSWEEALKNSWSQIKSESIDYGILEGAENLAVVPARGLGWNDVGSWNAIFEVLPSDENGNISNHQHHIDVDSLNSLVHVTNNPDKLVVTIGLEDVVVVDTGDVLMICNKDDAQKVRNAVAKLKETEYKRYL